MFGPRALSALAVSGLLALGGWASVSGATPWPQAASSMGAGSHAPLPQIALTLVNVTFKALGLPSGSSWSVTAGSPPSTRSNVTSGAVGRTVFSEPNNTTLNFSIAPPAGFGVARILGPGGPSQSSDLITGDTVLTVKFAPFESLSFNESGLLVGAVWNVTIHSSFPHGGPSDQTGTDTVTAAGGWINFTVVKGPWKFAVTGKPSDFAPHPSHGTVGVGAHNATRDIKFRMVADRVIFREHGLAGHTLWQVNITGPIDQVLASTSGAMRVFLPNGTYTFTVWNFSGEHPHPASGTFVVTAPGSAVVVVINYTALPSAAGPAPTPVLPAGPVTVAVARAP